MRTRYVLRVRVILASVIAVALVLVVRLYLLQVVHANAYRREANRQYVRSTHDLFDRGTIFFTTKSGEKVAAATTKVGYLVALNPTLVVDPVATYEALHASLPSLDKETFFVRVAKKSDPYEEIATHVDTTAAHAVRALALPGVQLFRDQWRYYPGGTLASHALGFIGYDTDGTILAGRYGLERYWEPVLARTSDALYVNFFAEVFANVSHALDEDATRAPQTGDIVTTIEPAVQGELERVLRATEEKWRAKQTAGIIMNPKTGDIYAMASLPDYDPNTFATTDEPRVFRNVLVEDVREMGSIVKPLAMAIGLDTGAVKPSTTYDDTGQVTIDGYTIRNYDGRARGVVSMQEVLNQSLNVGMAYVARQVGRERFGERMRTLGLGEETGIDLPSEARGLIDNLTSPREVEYATAAFGQGIALTPIATVRALSALGNGGYLVTPHLVRSIVRESGGERSAVPNDAVRVFSDETSEHITNMLVKVVDTALRGGAVKKEHYSIAAKTGTAQIAKQGERGYYDDRYLHSFFGYFPAHDPKFIVFLYHVEPQGAQYASETLTAPFMDLVDFLLNYYEVPPDR